MPLHTKINRRSPVAPALDLPPPFRAVMLREVGDAFAHAVRIAGKDGAGTLVHVGRFDRTEFAVVLEPEEPLRTARRALYAGLAALTDALAAHAPPEKPIHIVWPDAIRVDGGLVGGGRLAWPTPADEDAPPSWLVFGAAIRTAATDEREPGLCPAATTLDAEGFDVGAERLIESFARHFMVAVDAWERDGFAAIADRYLSRLALVKSMHHEIGENGDLLVRRAGSNAVERLSLVSALAQPSWLDPATGEPRQ